MDRVGIAKLDGTNYSSWKAKVEFLLIRDDLWRFVVGTRPEQRIAVAAAGSGNQVIENAAELEAWDHGDQRARATIGLLLEDSQLPRIKNSTTAKQCWNALREKFETVTLTSKVSLLKRLCNKEYAEGEDMQQHVLEMEEIFERLAMAGQALEENLRVAMVLRSLPSSFDTLTTALEARSDEELTMELVKTKLLDEVAKRGKQGSSESVLKVDHQKRKKVLICHFCKKPGHKEKFCRAKNGESSKREVKSDQHKVKTARGDATEKNFSFLTLDEMSGRDVWIIDSGATSHMCTNLDYFESIDRSVKQDVFLADGKKTTAEGVGSCKLVWRTPEGGRSNVTLSDVMYVPKLETNLISVKKLATKGVTVQFDANGCRIVKDSKVIGDTTMSGGLYKLQTVDEALRVSETKHSPDCLHSWHRILGHREPDAIRMLESKELATGIKIRDCGCHVTCECCLEGKMARLPFPKQSERKSKQPLDLIHTDVCGPMNTPTPSGCRYFVTMIDDFSRYTVVYFLKRKSDVIERIKEYVRFVQTFFGRTPKVIRSDQGGEFQNEALKRFCRDEGITQQFTTAYTPQQNGIAERKNRSLVEMARCLVLDARLPYIFWAEAVNTATYLQNRLPSKPIPTTPYELWTGEKPDLSHLQIFGSWAYVWTPDVKRSKLEAKSKKLLFVGYSMHHKAYRFIDLETKKLVVSRDCRFLTHQEVRETEPSQGSIVSYPFAEAIPMNRGGDAVPVVTVQDGDDEATSGDEDNADDSSEANLSGFETAFSDDGTGTDDGAGTDDGDNTMLPEAARGQEEHVEDGQPVRRSTRSTLGVLPKRYRDTVGLTVQEYCEPRTFAEAMKCPDREQWMRAMEEEMQSLYDNSTWEVVPLPDDRKPVGCKWVFKRKLDSNGEVSRYKARLVAQGFNQKFGTDYDEVFAPVAKQTTFRALLSIAARRKLLVKQVDVKSAYLYGELAETIYMKQPTGFETDAKDHVCLLKKSLYGLKQAGRVWNQRISDELRKLEYQPSEADPCLFVRTKAEDRSFVLLYVDDMLIACKGEEEYQRVEFNLQKHFKLTTLGNVEHYLGIRVQRQQNGRFWLDQSAYIRKITVRFGQADAKPSRIPMDPGYLKRQQKEEEPLPRKDDYQSLVGALLYVAVCTRPDIAISASILGRKVSNPSQADWTEAKRTLRYLKATEDLHLELGGPGSLRGYVDADWAGDHQDRKSNSGFVFNLGGPISWCARKQQCVTLSSTEAEYVALSEACRELLWLLKMMSDVGEEPAKPVVVFEDNQSCIAMLGGNGCSRKSKHIDTRYNFVRDLVANGVVDVQYCPTTRMVADILTKPLSWVKLAELRKEFYNPQPTQLEEE